MASNERMSAEDRRLAILEAAMPLFAEHGLNGVTTRQLAEAAGVSEALLYRHFESKEALFEGIKRHCLQEAVTVAEHVSALEPSTVTLVLATHFLVSEIIADRSGNARQRYISKLLLESLASDGQFARSFLEANVERWVPKLIECVAAADAAGDLTVTSDLARLRFWLTHHLAASIAFFHLPPTAPVDYAVDGEVLVEEAVRYALRGLGVRQDVIAKHYTPKALRLLTERLSQRPR